MYVLSTQLHNLPIISLQTGQAVAMATQPIINPDNLELVAFYCGSQRKRPSSTVLLTKDIRQTGRDGIVIDSADEIEEAGEIVRLKAVLSQNFKLVGLSVFNESHYRLGKVEEFTISLDTFQVQKLYLKQSVLKNLLLNNLVIDRSQIVEVTPKQIVVRDATVKKRLLNPQPAQPPAP